MNPDQQPPQPQPIPVQEPLVVQPAPVAPVTPAPPKKLDPKAQLGKLKDAFSPMFAKVPKPVKILLIVLFSIIFLLSLLVMFVPNTRRTLLGQPTPSPVAVTPTATSDPNAILNPSRYATDPGVVAIEEAVNKLESDLKSVDFREEELRIPLLDWDISFDSN